jgi:hypothetical protein
VEVVRELLAKNRHFTHDPVLSAIAWLRQLCFRQRLEACDEVRLTAHRPKYSRNPLNRGSRLRFFGLRE